MWHNLGEGFENLYEENSFAISGNDNSLILSSYGSDFGDYNCDGNYDLLLPFNINSEERINGTLYSISILQNSGKPNYNLNEKNLNNGIRFNEEHFAGRWGDVNNDGLLDIVITSYCECHSTDLYIQNSDNTFKLENTKSGFLKRSFYPDAIFIDMNNDGFQDILTFVNDSLKLFINTKECGKKNYISLDFNDEIGTTYLGAQVKVYSGNKVITQQLSSGKGLLVQNPLILHFGLENSDFVDSIVISKGDNNNLTLYSIEANKKYGINELTNKNNNITDNYQINVYPNPFTRNVNFDFSLSNKSDISLNILSSNGLLIKTLAEGVYDSGNYIVNWNAVDNNNVRVSAGVYLYVFKCGDNVVNGSIVFVE